MLIDYTIDYAANSLYILDVRNILCPQLTLHRRQLLVQRPSRSDWPQQLSARALRNLFEIRVYAFDNMTESVYDWNHARQMFQICFRVAFSLGEKGGISNYSIGFTSVHQSVGSNLSATSLAHCRIIGSCLDFIVFAVCEVTLDRLVCEWGLFCWRQLLEAWKIFSFVSCEGRTRIWIPQ